MRVLPRITDFSFDGVFLALQEIDGRAALHRRFHVPLSRRGAQEVFQHSLSRHHKSHHRLVPRGRLSDGLFEARALHAPSAKRIRELRRRLSGQNQEPEERRRRRQQRRVRRGGRRQSAAALLLLPRLLALLGTGSQHHVRLRNGQIHQKLPRPNVRTAYSGTRAISQPKPNKYYYTFSSPGSLPTLRTERSRLLPPTPSSISRRKSLGISTPLRITRQPDQQEQQRRLLHRRINLPCRIGDSLVAPHLL